MDAVRTDRLILRRAARGDFAVMYAVLGSPVAMRCWSTPPHRAIKQTRDWPRSMVDASHAESMDFIVEHEGKVIGKAGCRRLPEIGFGHDVTRCYQKPVAIMDAEQMGGTMVEQLAGFFDTE